MFLKTEEVRFLARAQNEVAADRSVRKGCTVKDLHHFLFGVLHASLRVFLSWFIRAHGTDVSIGV